MPTMLKSEPAATTETALFDSPIGPLRATLGPNGLESLEFADGRTRRGADHSPRLSGPMQRVRSQISAYFAHKRRDFVLPLAPTGTDFQQSVWRALLEIPCGETTTYARIAQRIGRPSAVRAVAQAIGANPIGVIIPCHRVIGSDGSLTGYAGGLDRKRALLEHESDNGLWT